MISPFIGFDRFPIILSIKVWASQGGGVKHLTTPKQGFLQANEYSYPPKYLLIYEILQAKPEKVK
jgi:hypothetical protein